MTTTEDQPRALYVGFGVGAYDDARFKALPRAVPDVEDIAEILRPYGYAVQVVPDPDEAALLDGLKAHLAQNALPQGGPLVIMWAGHGEMVAEQTLHLIARDTSKGAAPECTADRIASYAGRTGASQILLVFDTCHAQAGALPALTIAHRVLAARPPDARRVWVGVVTSALTLERARDGRFGAHLVRLLREGPRDEALRLRWSAHSVGVRGDDIIDALLKEWDVGGQSPNGYTAGNAWVMLPNPRYDPDAPERVVEHLLLAAQGRAPDEEGVYFTGRVAQLDQIVGWMRQEGPGVMVVTGPAGCGKTALAGRVVSLSNPAERASLLCALGEAPLGHADPGEGCVHAHVHARGLTSERLVEVLDDQLVARGLLPRHPAGSRNLGQLWGDLQARDRCPLLVIDGLDEAGLYAFRIAEDAIRLLSRVARVLVAARDLPALEGQMSLVGTLVPADVLDLGDESLREATEADVRGYIALRLAGVAAAMDPTKVADVVVGAAREQGEGVFLLARVVTSQLREEPVDTSRTGWERLISRSIEVAFERDLRLIPPLRRGDAELPHAATELLTALAWAYGAGFPDDVWPVAATALSPTGTAYDRADVFWLLGHAGRYIVEAGEAGRAAYRLSHQRLVDHLRRTSGASGEDTERQAAAVAVALVASYRALLDAGVPTESPPTYGSTYLWQYLWRHCADGGEEGIAPLRELARTHPAFLPDLAAALNNLGNCYREVGRPHDALAHTEQAVTLRRALSADNPAHLPDLAAALNNLGACYREVGRPHDALAHTEQAASIYRTLAADNPAHLPDLALALSNLGIRYAEVGRPHDALAHTEQAVTLRRALSADNPAHLPDLAAALNNLGNCYREVGRRHDAIAPTQQAASIYRTQAGDNPAHLPDLALALNNLGACYREVGRRHDAIAPTAEAVRIYRPLAAGNPAFLPDLALALNNLGACYREVGRRHDAIAPTAEAVRIYRPLAAGNPAHLPNLAAALNNLGACYREVGRRHDALAPAEQATRIYCALAGDNPAHLPNLASALTNLGNCYAQVGRPHDALAHTEQAVSIYQTQAANNPAHLPNLASALNNLGIHYRQVGRPHDALAHTEQAVTLYRTLAADNPAFLPDLAGVLTNLGACYRKVGRTHDAVAPTEEAISLYRAQAADNPAFLPDLAMALTNLGLRYVQVGRRHDAIAPTQQAVTLYRALAADNPAYLPDLAMALNNLGTCYAEVGRPHDAVTPTEQAVTLYRAQAADNPAHLPNLASALNNLGTCYTQVGRPHDAVTPTEQAVTLYRALAGDNPAHLPGLATALNNLGTCYTQVGVGDEIAHVWEQTIDLLPSVAAKAFLLIRRAEARPPSERVAAVRDLRRALRLVPRDEHRLVADCHATGRRLRALDPDAFDRVWPEALSPWLTLNQTHLDLTLEWIGTDTIEAEYAFFVAHVGELLGDATAVALDEIGLYQVDPTSVDVYRSLWDQARRGGVDEAYRLRLAGALLARWVDADLDAKREMLNERGDELLSTDVAEVLQTWREQDPEDDQLAIHEALLTLASAGHTATADPDHTAATAPADHTTAADTDHTAATAPADHTTAALTDHTAATAPADHTAAALTRHADAAFDALADPGRFPPLLNQLARAGADPAVLTAAATLARLATDRPQIQAAALFHLALALTRDGQTEEATATLHAAHAADPAQSTDWLRLLFELVPRHPELQALSSALLDCYSGHTAPE